MSNLKDKQSVYNTVFGNPVGNEVLGDLADFCYAMKTTAGRPESQERLEGRREVFLQIMTIMKMDVDAVFDDFIDDGF